VARVLVIDDDPSLLRAIRLGLRASGHDVVVAPNGEQGINQAALATPDVVVLDLGLPDIDGLTVCARIREWSDVPIIVLSANDAEDRKVAAFDDGADDYVTKPFGMAELEARIRTAIRHRSAAAEQTGPTTITAGPLMLDPVHHELRRDGAPIELTSKEFDVLAFLMRNHGKVCTHHMILTEVWGAAYANESQYVHVYVNRLRQKIGDTSGRLLKTVPGIGYVLATTDEPDAAPSRDG
jgi:two-component system KDP operon response regulator KdpE